jgi:hypothetical protein
MKDFFISYNKADRTWAEWIAWQLEASGWSVVVQAWDFRPGGNFALDMHRALNDTQRTIAVLSPSFLASDFTAPEWAATFARDPDGTGHRLVPVRVRDCRPTGLLAPIVYIDLVGLSSRDEARKRLLDGLQERVKPEREPELPRSETAVVQPATPEPPWPPALRWTARLARGLFGRIVRPAAAFVATALLTWVMLGVLLPRYVEEQPSTAAVTSLLWATLVACALEGLFYVRRRFAASSGSAGP